MCNIMEKQKVTWQLCEWWKEKELKCLIIESVNICVIFYGEPSQETDLMVIN